MMNNNPPIILAVAAVLIPFVLIVTPNRGDTILMLVLAGVCYAAKRYSNLDD